MILEKKGIYYYNDYELLYLAAANIEEAKEILFWKYSFLIKSRISKLHIDKFYYEDFFQEGCITLLKAMKIYNENSPMRFTNFLDLLIRRRFITILRKEIKAMNTEKKEEIDYADKNTYLENVSFSSFLLQDDIDIPYLSSFEKEVYDGLFKKNKKVNVLANELNVDTKKVSNAKQRLLKKMRSNLKIKN